MKVVKVFTANMRGMQRYNGKEGVVISRRSPFRTGHPDDDRLPDEIKVKMRDGRVITIAN